MSGLIEEILADKEGPETCPFCGRDPYHYVDVGVGRVPAAVECCEYGIDLFQYGQELLQNVASKLWAREHALLAAERAISEVEKMLSEDGEGAIAQDMDAAFAAYREAVK